VGPWDHAAAMPSGQPLAPDAHHLIGEPTQAPTIPTDAIVGEVAPHHRGQAAMLVAERPMAVFPAPGSNCGPLRGHTGLWPSLAEPCS
jgi:hypothetical protein